MTIPGDKKDLKITNNLILKHTRKRISNKAQSLWKEIIKKVKVAQSCLTLWDPMNDTVHGSLQARTLEWVAFPFSRGPP